MADTTLRVLIVDPQAGTAPAPTPPPAGRAEAAPAGPQVGRTFAEPPKSSGRSQAAATATATPTDDDRAFPRLATEPRSATKVEYRAEAPPGGRAETGVARNGLVADTAAGLDRLRVANRELRDSLTDGSHLRQRRELVELRREEAKLAKEAAREGVRARYGVAGAAAVRAAGLATAAGSATAEVARLGGQTATQLAGNNNAAAFATTTGAVASAVSTLGPAGAAAGAGLRAVAVSTTAAVGAIEAFAARGRELAKYDGRLALAGAQADVTRLNSDIREADVLGPALAALIEKQAEAEATFREMMLPVRKFLIETLGGFLDVSLNVMNNVLKFLEENSAVPQLISDWAREAREALKADKAKTTDALIGNWLDAVNGLGPTALAPDPIRHAADALLAPPLLGLEG